LHRRNFIFLSMCTLLLALTGCIPPGHNTFTGVPEGIYPSSSSASTAPADDAIPLFDFIKDDRTVFADQFATNIPFAVSYAYHGIASGPLSPVLRAETIQNVFEALSGIVVVGESDIIYEDNDHAFVFTMADGMEYIFRFNGHALQYGGKNYILENDSALWSIDFPVYDDRSIFSAYSDDAITSFAQNFAQDAPISISTSYNRSAPAVVEDAEHMQAIFNAMCMIELSDIKSASDLADNGNMATRAIVFTMRNGQEFHFNFLGNYLEMEFGEPIGVRYYFMDDTADNLFNIAFPGYESIP